MREIAVRFVFPKDMCCLWCSVELPRTAFLFGVSGRYAPYIFLEYGGNRRRKGFLGQVQDREGAFPFLLYRQLAQGCAPDKIWREYLFGTLSWRDAGCQNRFIGNMYPNRLHCTCTVALEEKVQAWIQSGRDYSPGNRQGLSFRLPPCICSKNPPQPAPQEILYGNPNCKGPYKPLA